MTKNKIGIVILIAVSCFVATLLATEEVANKIKLLIPIIDTLSNLF
jgi:hypothetical protein